MVAPSLLFTIEMDLSCPAKAPSILVDEAFILDPFAVVVEEVVSPGELPLCLFVSHQLIDLLVKVCDNLTGTHLHCKVLEFLCLDGELLVEEVLI